MSEANTPDWQRWGGPDPIAEETGISFRREPAGEIRAPAGKFRVCAYHFDFDEAPTVYADVDTREEAERIVRDFFDLKGGWNVDYCAVYDEHGEIVAHNRPW